MTAAIEWQPSSRQIARIAALLAPVAEPEAAEDQKAAA